MRTRKRDAAKAAAPRPDKDAVDSVPDRVPEPEREAAPVEQKPAEITDETPVTVGMLKGVLADMSSQFETRMGELEQTTINRLNATGTEIQNMLKDFGDRMNAQPQQTTEKEGITEFIQPLLEKAVNKYMGAEDAPTNPLDQQTFLIRKMIDREAQKVAMKMIRQGMNKGLLLPDEVESVLQDSAAHDPR